MGIAKSLTPFDIYAINNASLEDTLDYSIQVLQDTGLPETLSSTCEDNWVDIDTSNSDYRKYWCQVHHLIKKEDYSNFLFKYRTYTSLVEDCDTLSEHLDLIKEIKAPDGNQSDNQPQGQAEQEEQEDLTINRWKKQIKTS